MPHQRHHPFLLFGYFEEDGTPNSFQCLWDIDAEHSFHLPGLMQEIIELRKHSSTSVPTEEYIHLAALISLTGANTLYEINPHLFSSIDQLTRQLPSRILKELSFVGIEPYPLFGDVAKVIHPESNLLIFPTWTDAPSPPVNSVCRSRWAATQFISGKDHANWLSQFSASQNLIWFSPEEHDQTFEYMGHRLLLASFKGFSSTLKKKKHVIDLHKARRIDFFGTELIELSLTCYDTTLLKSSPSDTLTQSILSTNSVEHIQDIPPEKWDVRSSFRAIKTNRIDSLFFSDGLRNFGHP